LVRTISLEISVLDVAAKVQADAIETGFDVTSIKPPRKALTGALDLLFDFDVARHHTRHGCRLDNLALWLGFAKDFPCLLSMILGLAGIVIRNGSPVSGSWTGWW
jgi:hypothetical protein